MWAVAAILLIWQVVLTFALLRSREDDRDEVANIGRMAYAFSEMLDRLEQIQASIPSAPPPRWSEPYAHGHACGHGCGCHAAGPAPEPPRYQDPYGPRDGYAVRDSRDGYSWGRQAEGYGRPVSLHDPHRRR